jgi:hypothetical protein
MARRRLGLGERKMGVEGLEIPGEYHEIGPG